MRLIAAICLAVQAAAAAAQDQVLRLPSGLEARLQETLTDRHAGSGLVYRFRFVAEGLRGGDAVFDEMTADLEWLCTEYALPRIADIGPRPGRVVISLSDRPSAVGVHDADVLQVFEVFRLGDGTCEWEMF